MPLHAWREDVHLNVARLELHPEHIPLCASAAAASPATRTAPPPSAPPPSSVACSPGSRPRLKLPPRNLAPPIAHAPPDVLQIRIVVHHGAPAVAVHGHVRGLVALPGARGARLVGAGAREGAGARRAARAGVDCVAVVADIAQRSRGSTAAAFRVHGSRKKIALTCH